MQEDLSSLGMLGDEVAVSPDIVETLEVGFEVFLAGWVVPEFHRLCWKRAGANHSSNNPNQYIDDISTLEVLTLLVRLAAMADP